MVNNWLVTGGCGFIGTSLIKSIIKSNSNANIRVLDNLSVGSKEDLSLVCNYKEISSDLVTSGPRGIELLVGDIRDPDVSMKAAHGIDVIVHLAANTGVAPSIEDPQLDCTINVMGTFNILESARAHDVKQFIFASSGAPIGDCNPPIHEELAPHPVSPYGASKLAGEGYCSAYFKSFGLNTVALRFGNVYGPGSIYKESVVAKFIKRAIGGEQLEIYGDGSQTRDFIYIDDLVRAIIMAANSDIGGEVFQIASSHETTVGEMAEQLVVVLEDNGVTDIEMINAEARVGDVKRNFSDTSKAKSKLGWQPQVNLKNGLEKTINYFIEKANG